MSGFVKQIQMHFRNREKQIVQNQIMIITGNNDITDTVQIIYLIELRKK